MNLLEEGLPEASFTLDVDTAAFLDRCETIARSHGWSTDRRREHAGAGSDQLNIHLASGDPGYPMLRMVAAPRNPRRLSLDVVASWKRWPIGYDEYVQTLRTSYAPLIKAYDAAHAKRLRLSLPRRRPRLEMKAVDCNRIGYAVEKLGGLSRTLATGKGDARDRLINAFWTFHVIRPTDLPEPIRTDLQRVYDQITRRPARHRFEGSVEATVRSMKNSTAAAILERLLDIAEAVQVLEEACNRRRDPDK